MNNNMTMRGELAIIRFLTGQVIEICNVNITSDPAVSNAKDIAAKLYEAGIFDLSEFYDLYIDAGKVTTLDIRLLLSGVKKNKKII